MISLYFDITPKAKQSFRIGKHSYQSKAVTDYQKRSQQWHGANRSEPAESIRDAVCVYRVRMGTPKIVGKEAHRRTARKKHI